MYIFNGTYSLSLSLPLTHTRRVAIALSIWINTGKAELVKDTVFLQLLKTIQDGLTKDSLVDQLTTLNSSLADSIRSAAQPGGNTHLLNFAKVSEVVLN